MAAAKVKERRGRRRWSINKPRALLPVKLLTIHTAALTRHAVEAIRRGKHCPVRPVQSSIQVVGGHVHDLKPCRERRNGIAGHAIQRIPGNVEQRVGGRAAGGGGGDVWQPAGEVVAGEVENAKPSDGEQRRRDRAG